MVRPYDPSAADQYRVVRQQPLGGGIVDSLHGSLLKDDQASDALNIDFDRMSVATTRGSRKFNNQVAPGSAIRTRAPQAHTPLYHAAGISVPLRGYGIFPHNEAYDLGGLVDSEGTFPNETFHNRRGHSFERAVSFKVPPEEKLFEAETRGSAAPAVGAEDANFIPPHGYDEALDECFLVWQKGGDSAAPMSWAIGVVNVGKLNTNDATVCTLPVNRPSNYALVFMWLDSAARAERAPAAMMYSLSSATLPTSDAYSTQAYRAVVIHKFVEPGQAYHCVVQLSMDTGTPGALATPTSWNNDGYFRVYVRQEHRAVESFSCIDSGGGVTVTGMEVWKGPQDSLRYLCKYGVRFFGRDPEFSGLGMRYVPWKVPGFIPYGADATSLNSGGFRMMDRSAITVNSPSVYNGTHTLTLTKAALGDAYANINHDGFTSGNADGGADPSGIWGGAAYVSWVGQGGGALPFNAEALRGYRLVTTGDWTAGTPDAKGMVLSILNYVRNGAADYRVFFEGANTIGAFAAAPILVQAFRWHQRDLIIQNLSARSGPCNYEDTDPRLKARRRWRIGRSIRVDDNSDPDNATLTAVWPLDDAGGGVLREELSGGARNGRLAPCSLAQSSGGTRGGNTLFLSGEGDALCLDFTQNPVAMRELQAMLRGSSQGFAVEVTCVFPGSVYGVQGQSEPLPDGGGLLGCRARFAPDLVTWEVKDGTASGLKSRPRSIVKLTHRGLYSDQSSAPYKRPLGFQVEVGHRSDQDDIDGVVHSNLQPWYTSGGLNTNRFNLDAPWVGKTVTIQVGIQSTGVADQYDVYVAMTPKESFFPKSGDPGSAEYQLWTDGAGAYDVAYFTTAHLTIRKKELARSVVTIGGRWNPQGLGYSEINARMILDEVRVFATSGPGALSTASGQPVTARNGKLEGNRSLPARALEDDEVLQDLGLDLKSVAVTQGSATITPIGLARFAVGEARDTIEAVKDCYLQITGEEIQTASQETDPVNVESWQRITAVAADGSSATLADAQARATRNGVRAQARRLIGYTSFEEDISGSELSLPAGSGYTVSSTAADIALSGPLFENKALASVPWRIRLFCNGSPAKEILPQWVRGLVSPRRSKIGEGVLGLATHDSTIYAAVRGAIYIADDRWRDKRVVADTMHGIKFLAEKNPPSAVSGVRLPRACDRLEFTTVSGWSFTPDDSKQFRIDARIECADIGGYQTVVWVGDTGRDPNGNCTALIVRLNRGRPELVIGSSATYDGVNSPDKFQFIAYGQTQIQPGEAVHIRWYLSTRASGTILQVPYLKVNGRTIPVVVSTKDADASITQATDWMRVSTMTSPNLSSLARVVVGCARDAYRTPESNSTITAQAQILRPQRLHGYMHSLSGTIYEVVTTYLARWSGSAPPDFDHTNISYGANSLLFRILGSAAEGRGAKVKDAVSSEYGVIRSHPFLSVFHELGQYTDPVTFARHGSQLYAANGGRPVVVIDEQGMFAGVEPPSQPPAFNLTRFPIWKQNVRDKTSAANPANDPIDGALNDDALRIYHYRSDGNTYLQLVLDPASGFTTLDWEKQYYFAFKQYVRLDSVAGRINIARKGSGLTGGGPFVECRDGFLYVGWYDAATKTERSLHSSEPVFFPGLVTYIHVRLQWPEVDTLEGNFRSAYYSGGNLRRVNCTGMGANTFAVGDIISNNAALGAATAAGIVTKALAKTNAGAQQTIEFVYFQQTVVLAGAIRNNTQAWSAGGTSTNPFRPMWNSVVVRKFPTSVPALYDAIDSKPALAYADPIGRSCVSFTSDYGQTPTGCTATGLVSPPGMIFTGTAVAGVVNVGSVASATPLVPGIFTPDMVGMLWQWASDAGVAADVYRISTYTSPTSITVVKLDGTAAPNFNGVTNKHGGVFTGITLIKSAGFDLAGKPDTQAAVIEMMGSSAQSDPLGGFTPFVGDMWCPGITNVNTAGTGINYYEDVHTFENFDTRAALGVGDLDPVYTGTDKFDYAIYDGLNGEPGELRATSGGGFNFWLADFQTYGGAGGNASTQPNAARTVAKDTNPVCSAGASDIATFQYIQKSAVWTAEQFLAVTFHDKTQGVESNPCTTLKVKPSAEDGLNPAGLVRINLTNLPASSERGDVELFVYKALSATDTSGSLTQAGVESVQTQVGTVAAGTRETSIAGIERSFTSGQFLEFNNGPPPHCKVVACAQNRLWYGALTDPQQLDGLQFSKAFLPAQVPAANFGRLNDGAGEAITAMADLDGQLVAAVRQAIFALAIDTSTGALLDKAVSGGSGCVAPISMVANEKALLYRGDRGIYIYKRGDSSSDLGEAGWVSEPIKSFFEKIADRLYSYRSSAAMNKVRRSYVLTEKLSDEKLTRHRVSLEGSGAFGRHSDPNVTALCSVQPEGGGSPRLVGGTEEGFVIWLDDDTTQLHGIGTPGDGDSVLTISSASAYALQVSAGNIDAELEGPRGLVARWEGGERSILGSQDGVIVVEDIFTPESGHNPSLIPAGTLTVGAQEHLWESGWIDMGDPEKNKWLRHLDLIFGGKGVNTGLVDLTIFVNKDDSVTNMKFPALSVASKVFRVDPATLGRTFKFRVESSPLTAGAQWEIIGAVWRIGEADQR